MTISGMPPAVFYAFALLYGYAGLAAILERTGRHQVQGSTITKWTLTLGAAHALGYALIAFPLQ